LIIADLPEKELARRLTGPGLRLRTGPFVTEIRSRLTRVAEGITLHYSDYPVEASKDFADFHVRLAPPRSVRRWLRPQVTFQFDGAPPFLPLPADQAFPIMEWGLNWCVSSHCHQYLVIHAAVVERSGHALLLPAPPGSGKSTLCAGLVSRGWRLLSDELALIDPLTANIMPLPRPISLKNASIEVIRDFSPNAVLGPTVRDTLKGSVAHVKAPADSVRRAAEPARPRWIVLPRYQAGAPTRPERLRKGRAFMHVADSAFNYNLHGRKGFETLAQVIEASDCYEFAYGDLGEAVKLFDRLATTA
jgi:HprK-related kinase A